jgi:hypothetical protein
MSFQRTHLNSVWGFNFDKQIPATQRLSRNYRLQRPDDTAVRERLRELATERVISGAPGWICTILGRMIRGCAAGLRPPAHSLTVLGTLTPHAD